MNFTEGKLSYTNLFWFTYES